MFLDILCSSMGLLALNKSWVIRQQFYLLRYSKHLLPSPLLSLKNVYNHHTLRVFFSSSFHLLNLTCHPACHPNFPCRDVSFLRLKMDYWIRFMIYYYFHHFPSILTYLFRRHPLLLNYLVVIL